MLCSNTRPGRRHRIEDERVHYFVPAAARGEARVLRVDDDLDIPQVPLDRIWGRVYLN